MARHSQQRRRRRPKVTAEALDEWLWSWAEARHRKPSKDEDGGDWLPEDDLPETVTLGYPLDTALLLWRGYSDHGLLPFAGGLLDQPRRWRRLIRLLDDRAMKIEAAYKALGGDGDPLSGMDFSGAGGLSD